MTLPASGPISLSQVNTELQLSSTATISLNDTNVRTLFGVPSGAISMSNGYGKSYVIPGNSGILTSGSSFTLPSTSGASINVLAIGGGGGGGGGSGRTSFAGFFTGGGGGGAGGNAYAVSIPVTPGQTISFSIGGAGGAGTARDGIYTSGANGGTGGDTSITVNSTLMAYSYGGSGGAVSPNATGGLSGGTGAGSPLLVASNGGTAASGATTGGYGARGYAIDTTVGTSIGYILSFGSFGTISGSAGSGVPPTPGTIYGAGGGGGGCAQSDAQPGGNINPNAGTNGAVFIWWGY